MSNITVIWRRVNIMNQGNSTFNNPTLSFSIRNFWIEILNAQKLLKESSCRYFPDLLRPFFKCQSETLNFHSLTLNQFANGFLHRNPWFINILKIRVPKPYTPLPHFSNFQALHFLILVPICSWISHRSDDRYGQVFKYAKLVFWSNKYLLCFLRAGRE